MIKDVSIPDIGKINNDLSLEYVTLAIKNKLAALVENFWDIGEMLNFIQDNKLFKSENYPNLLDYTKSKFGLSKNQTYNFINIYKKFNNSKYQDFNYSNLVEMLSLNDSQLQEVTSTSTVKEIRNIKKNKPIKNKNDKDLLISNNEIQEVQEIKTVQEVQEIKIDEVIKEKFLSDFQIKLLDFFIDNYWQSFSNDYQSKFDKSNKLEKVFGRNNICISTEIGIIHDILTDLKK